MIFEIIKYFLILIFAIIIHELGHYTVTLIYGVKPSIKFENGAIVVYSPLMVEFIPKQMFLVLLYGVFIGFIVIPFDPIYIIPYLFMSMSDIVNMYNLIPYLKSKKTIMQLNIESTKQQLKDLEKATDRYMNTYHKMMVKND